MKFKILLVVLIFFLFALIFILLKNENKAPQYEDLHSLIAEKYGNDCVIAIPPPAQDKFILAQNDFVFLPGEEITGTLVVDDDFATYHLRFSEEIDNENDTIICAVKGQHLGWVKVVLKKESSTPKTYE